jgi:hypothetical protein
VLRSLFRRSSDHGYFMNERDPPREVARDHGLGREKP